MKQVQDEPVPPRELNPEIDPSLEAIILKAMSKNPMERFATAKDMRSALNDYLAGRPVALGAGFTGAQTQIMATCPTSAPCPTGHCGHARSGRAAQPARRQLTEPFLYVGQHGAEEEGQEGCRGSGRRRSRGRAYRHRRVRLGWKQRFREQIEVPDVTGQTLDQAKSAIQSAGFKVGNVTQSYSDSVDSWARLSARTPRPRQRRQKGSISKPDRLARLARDRGSRPSR